MASATRDPTGSRTEGIARHPITRSALPIAFLAAISLLALPLLTADPPPSHQPATIEVSDVAGGSTVRLHTGDTLQVALDGNPTTGYTWEVAACDSAMLKPAGEPQFVAESAALGSGGKVITRFFATGTGESKLKLIYHRPFEKEAPALKTFDLTVVVER